MVIGVLAAAALLTSTSTLLAQGAVKQTANVVGQGPAGPIVAENGATVTRGKNGVGIALTMPTPLPGRLSGGSRSFPVVGKSRCTIIWNCFPSTVQTDLG